MFAVCCLMLEAWGLRLDACWLMVDAWCLNTCQTHPQREPKAASLCGWVWQVFKHQASSIKHPPSSIKHLFCHQSTHHGSWSTFDQTDLDHFSARVFSKFCDFRIFGFAGSQFWKCWVCEVWHHQSGPKSVSINPYGIPEPPKPLRNC